MKYVQNMERIYIKCLKKTIKKILEINRNSKIAWKHTCDML